MEKKIRNLPIQFVERTKPLLGTAWDAFTGALNQEPPVSVRINKAKYSEIPNGLQDVPWSMSGYYLPERPSFTFDPLFHAGCYYPQEASSMFIEQAVRQCTDGSARMLDLCAAPGGKSTHLLSLLSDDSFLVSNEVIRSRANILAENIAKWGYANSIVTNNDPSEFGKLGSYFDVILVDAPCSGEGMFRKDEIALQEWSESNVRLCKERQQRILADVWGALKTDGILIYSTCTYNTDENEDNVQWICDNLGAEPVEIDIPDMWGVTSALKGDLPVYRFLPHKTKGEGFFLAVLRKTDVSDKSLSSHRRNNKRKDKKEKTKNDSRPAELKDCIKDGKEFIYSERNGLWNAIPAVFEDDNAFLSENLKIISSGIHLGEVKGRDFIPAQSLALSIDFDHSAFPVCDVDWRKAITFLQKNSILLDTSYPKGYILLKYRNVPLGFVKNIGNRTNNLYPQEWKIRTTNIPDNFNSFL